MGCCCASPDSEHAAIAGVAGDKEAEKATLPKPVLTPLQQHFQQEGTAYMVALVDEKPASRWALWNLCHCWPGMCLVIFEPTCRV